MTCIDLKELSPAVLDLVAEAPHAAGHWRICLITMLGEENDKIDGVSTLDFVSIDEQFAGSSILEFLSEGEVQGSVGIYVDGEIRAGTAIMNLHIHAEEMKAAVFECKGSQQGNEHRYDGTWYAPCTNPDCDCSGLTGRFELSRLDP